MEKESRNLSQEIANCDKSEDNKLKDNMEKKELNLAELLKDYIGDIFFHPRHGDVEVGDVDENYIELRLPEGGIINIPSIHCLHPTGMAFLYPDAESLKKYPFDGIVAWMEWKEARKPKRWTPQVGERIFFVNSHGAVSQDFCRSDEEGNEHQLKRRAIGNEFRTGKAAETFAKIFRETLVIFHEKNAGRDI